MIFMVLVGGLGTFEGPIIGAIVLFAIQNQYGNDGVWYLVGLGATAMLFALRASPRGASGERCANGSGFASCPSATGWRGSRFRLRERRERGSPRP